MEQVRYCLIQLNAQTGLDISGHQSTFTFHSEVRVDSVLLLDFPLIVCQNTDQVIARRENDSGEVNVLLKWRPTDMYVNVLYFEPSISQG